MCIRDSARLLREANRRRHAGIRHRDDHIGLRRRFARQLAAHSLAHIVDMAAADDGIRPREIDVFEDTRPRRHRRERLMRLHAVLVEDHHFAVLHVAHVLRADDVERAGLRRQNRAAVELADHQRANAEWIARADQLFVGQADKGIGAFELAQALDETVDEAVAARARRNRFVDRFIEGLRQLEGAYAFVGLTNKKLVGARDPFGIRPLVIGKLDGCPILASETCALDIIGAQYVRDVENGEVVIFDEDGMQSHKPFPPMAARPCIFEYIYFSRPDSIVGGRHVYNVRKTMGRELAREAPAQADVVVPVPDSGVPAAIGFAQESGIPYELGIIRNHYVGRTFIQPTQSIRDQGVRMKHAANRAVVAGKRIVLVDDSIVRGTTSRKIVQMMRDAGAKEVHFRIASPPITHPDYYGIDTPERDKLLAATHDLEGMRQFIGADSLAFLSVDGIYRAMGFDKRDAARPQFTDHCFTGDYPTALTDLAAQEASPRQLSLLAEAI